MLSVSSHSNHPSLPSARYVPCLLSFHPPHAPQPPKVPVDLGPGAAFAHAMPAAIPSIDGKGRTSGAKWISGGGAVGIGGLIVVEKPEAGGVRGIVAASGMTAVRTAAVSGAALRLAPPQTERALSGTGAPLKVAFIGGGVQCFSHRDMLEVVLPGASVAFFSRRAVSELPLRAEDRMAASAADAMLDADVIITSAAFGTAAREILPGHITLGATVVVVDYSATISGEFMKLLCASRACRVVTDCIPQFDSNRSAGKLGSWGAAEYEMGALPPVTAAQVGTTTIVNHLGVSSCDLVLAEALLGVAEQRSMGTMLPP